MRRISAFAARFMLLVFLTGCSGARTAYFPGEPTVPDGIEVKVGQDVVVSLESGDEVMGEVLAVGRESVTIGRPSNYGYLETMVPVGDIQSIRTQGSDSIWTALGGVAAFMGIVIVGMFTWLMLDPPGFN